MKQSVSNDKDSVSIQIVIIEMDYKFNRHYWKPKNSYFEYVA
jgi:hypothetical protein